jgi:hypothetical protein
MIVALSTAKSRFSTSNSLTSSLKKLSCWRKQWHHVTPKLRACKYWRQVLASLKLHACSLTLINSTHSYPHLRRQMNSWCSRTRKQWPNWTNSKIWCTRWASPHKEPINWKRWRHHSNIRTNSWKMRTLSSVKLFRHSEMGSMTRLKALKCFLTSKFKIYAVRSRNKTKNSLKSGARISKWGTNLVKRPINSPHSSQLTRRSKTNTRRSNLKIKTVSHRSSSWQMLSRVWSIKTRV